MQCQEVEKPDVMKPKPQKPKPGHGYKPAPGFAYNPLLSYPRNDECFCGSKKKFKKCCLDKIPRVVKKSDAKKYSNYMKSKFNT